MQPGLGPAGSRADDSAIDLWADWAVGRTVWKGPTVDWPERQPRPAGELRLRSALWPLSLHAPLDTPPERARQILQAAEASLAILAETGWPAPAVDSGTDPDFDVFVVPSATGNGAAMDAPLEWTWLDAASSHARIVGSFDDERTAACAMQAVTEAGLWGRDPAESDQWRKGTAAFVTWLALGRFGCAGAASGPAWIDDDPDGRGTALFLAMLAARQDGGTGHFVRGLWEFSRQHSSDKGKLRASPNFWEALDRALHNAGESLQQVLEDFAVARYFAGPESRRRHAPYPVLRTLDVNAAVEAEPGPAMNRLPKRIFPAPRGLLDHGSAYALLDVRGLDSRLVQVWLRGEPGARWALTAVRLTADGAEAGRMNAPPRRTPRGYLPVLLTEETAEVLLVVTKFPLEPIQPGFSRLRHGFELLVDRGD